MSTSVSKNDIPKEKNNSIENTSSKRDITIFEKNIYDLTNKDIEEHFSVSKSNVHLKNSIEIIDVEEYRSYENILNSKMVCYYRKSRQRTFE